MDNNTKIPSNADDPQNWVEEYRDSLFNYALDRLRDAELLKKVFKKLFWLPCNHIKISRVCPL